MGVRDCVEVNLKVDYLCTKFLRKEKMDMIISIIGKSRTFTDEKIKKASM